MKNVLGVATILFLMGLSAVFAVAGTNGTQLIGIGPISRSMGGTGIAYPMDAISAVFGNPAAMCFGLYCPNSQVDFSVSLLSPNTEASVSGPGVGGTIKAEADNNVFVVPAIGLSIPITEAPRWRFGLSAYGVSGLGGDYRGTDLDQPNFYAPGAPLVTGEYTNLQTTKFAPAIAFQPFGNLSFGLTIHLDYESFDIRNGSSYDFGWGAQAGLIYKPTDYISLGLTYISPQNVEHENVADLDSDGKLDELELESPQQIGIGAAYHVQGDKLVVEGDIRWLNWSDANGYKDIDFEDQLVTALGLQYKPTPKLALRAGYNYGKSPLDDHDGFIGTGVSSIQGHYMPTYYFETFRTIGFATILEHQVTFGISYEFSQCVAMHLGYEHSFENTLKTTGTDLARQPVTLESDVSGNTFDIGLIFRF